MAVFDTTKLDYIAKLNNLATGLLVMSTQNANFNAVAGNWYFLTATGKVATLPATPSPFDRIRFSSASSAVSSLTLSRNGNNINSVASDYVCNGEQSCNIELEYINSTIGWRVISSLAVSDVQNQVPQAFTTTGTAPNFVLTPAPAQAALTTNHRYNVKFHAAATAPTLAISGLAAKNVMQYDAGGNKVAANITANLIADVMYDGTDYVVLDAMQRGTILQVANVDTGAVASGSTLIPTDDTIPQSTEGDQYMSLSITPLRANSVLLIFVTAVVSGGAGGHATVAIFRDSTVNAIAAVPILSNGSMWPATLSAQAPANAAAATTFKVRAGLGSAGTLTFNGTSTARQFGGVMASSIRVFEIAA